MNGTVPRKYDLVGKSPVFAGKPHSAAAVRNDVGVSHHLSTESETSLPLDCSQYENMSAKIVFRDLLEHTRRRTLEQESITMQEQNATTRK